MSHVIVADALLATAFASSLLPLTLRLLPVVAEIAQLILHFHSTALTPTAAYDFETKLQALLREMGRIIAEWTYNSLEPEDPHVLPNLLCFDGQWYRRRQKTRRRNLVATLFGTITLWRYLYQPIDGVERSIFPLELRLGLVAGLATPALAEHVARAATEGTQETVRAELARDHGVAWSVKALRNVIAATWEGMMPHLHNAQVAQILAWLEQAQESRGARKPVLAVGRDGVFVPIRGAASYREASTATVSVHDRAGKRLGTIYLGQMPEAGQTRLSEQLTQLVVAVLTAWSGPLPRLAYVTDAGHHPTEYFKQVLKPMCHPCRPGVRLHWEWVIDYYHVATYIHKMAEALFRDARRAHAWARKMCRWLKTKPRAIFRILHSAAALRSRRIVIRGSKGYQQAYDYLRSHMHHLDYVEYRKAHLPIGSGVTEAACKTVFSERLRRSGMTWSVEGGQRIVDLRVVRMSEVWSDVYRAYLESGPCPDSEGQRDSGRKHRENAA